MRQVLTNLFFKVDGDCVEVPSFREDVACMNDLAEEIVRIYGYNEIRSTGISGNMTQGQRNAPQRFEYGLHQVLCGMGLYEINTFSFISPKYYDKINLPVDSSLRNSVTISNPLGEDTSVMRTTARLLCWRYLRATPIFPMRTSDSMKWRPSISPPERIRCRMNAKF